MRHSTVAEDEGDPPSGGTEKVRAPGSRPGLAGSSRGREAAAHHWAHLNYSPADPFRSGSGGACRSKYYHLEAGLRRQLGIEHPLPQHQAMYSDPPHRTHPSVRHGSPAPAGFSDDPPRHHADAVLLTPRLRKHLLRSCRVLEKPSRLRGDRGEGGSTDLKRSLATYDQVRKASREPEMVSLTPSTQ